MSMFVIASERSKRDNLRFIRQLRLPRRLCLLALLVGLLAMTAFADSRNPQAIRAFNEGAQHFNAKEYSEALPFFDQAIEHDSEFAQAYYARGTCRQYLKDPLRAMSDLNQAIRLDPSLLDAYAARGTLSYESEQWEPALADFNYVLSLRPTDAQSLLARGVIYLKREEISKAQKDFRAFLRLRPDDPLAPRLRKLLASLSPGEEELGESPAAPSPQTSPAGAPRRNTRAAQQMGEELFLRTRALSEQATRQAMRGERVEVTGDPKAFTPERSKPRPAPTSSHSGPQIVEPQ